MLNQQRINHLILNTIHDYVTTSDSCELAMSKRKLDEDHQECLQRCLRVRGASERAINEVWNIIQPQDLQLGRGTFVREVAHDLQCWKDASVPVKFKRIDGPEICLPLLNLQLYLQKLCEEAPAFQGVMRKVLQRSPVLTPVLYCDECQAGNVLAVHKSRKSCMWYMSWVELWHHLKNQHAWMPITAIQSQCLHEIEGGASLVTVEIIKHLISQKELDGFEIADGLTFRQSMHTWYVGDHESVRSVFSIKGSGGMRPCILCANVVKNRSGVEDDYFKEISAAGGFAPTTDADVFRVCDAMRLPCSRKELETQEITSGISYNPHTLMWSDVRSQMPPSRVCYDYMHTYLFNGVASWEVSLFLELVFNETAVTRQIFQDAVSASEWISLKRSGKTPTYLRNLLHERMFGDGLYKGQAHQTSAIVPLIRYYLDTMFERALPQDAVRSFRCLSDILTLVRDLQNGLQAVDRESMDQFQKLQQTHHVLFGKAYGNKYRPKHHHRFHLKKQWLDIGAVITCEAHEAKHQVYKAGIADNLRSNVHDFDRFSASVLHRMMATCCDLLKNKGLPFWELLPPILEADMDDRLAFACLDLKKSKSHSVGILF